MSKQFITLPKSSQWKVFTGDTLTDNAIAWGEKNDIFRCSYGNWLIGLVWYKGETPETATDWVIVSDDGGYYKVNASYMIWYTTLTGSQGAQAIWSSHHLKKSLKSLLTEGATKPDPDYTT